MIRFENVTKEYPNGTIALNKVSFTIDPGEFVFFVGPSGAGKTTILRLLLAELKPSSGVVRINDADLASLKRKKLPELRRQIGAVFQDYKLIEDRTVAENVALVSEMVKSTQEEVEKHVQEILALVGLEDKADLFPSQLSGGELQRTTIARALATQPKILFADEPTGNLDQGTAWEIINLLLILNKKDTTVIMATHNQELISSVDRRIIELQGGRVVSDTKKPKEKKKTEKKKEGEGKKVKSKKKGKKETETEKEKEKEKETESQSKNESKQEDKQ